MPVPRRISIKDVAREADVSISAVSRAFSPGSSLAEDKRRRILATAERLGYHPSSLARGLVRKQSRTVTLVTGRLWDSFDALFLEGLAEALADWGQRLVVAPASRQDASSGGVFQALSDQSEAVIITAGTMPAEASSAAVRAGVPVIVAGRIMEGKGIDCVAAHNADGARQAADLFLRTECRKPAYFGFAASSPADRERGEAYSAAMAQAGLTPAALHVATRDDEDIFETASAMLAARERPDAVFCATDRLAFGVLEAARALGIGVPDELSVIGFNNVTAAARRTYQLTTVNYPVSRVVAEILDILKMRLSDPHLPPMRRRIPVSLIVRATTRRLRK